MKSMASKMFLILLVTLSTAFADSGRFVVKAKVCDHEELGDYVGAAIKGGTLMKEKCYSEGYNQPVNIIVLKHKHQFFCGIYQASFACTNN